jgi:hypothetical protein
MTMKAPLDLSILATQRGWRFSLLAAFFAMLATLVPPQPSRAASANEMRSTSEAWRKQNACALDSFHRYPDYTPQGNVNRDRAMRTCEAENHLPMRQDGEHSPVVQMPDSDARE